MSTFGEKLVGLDTPVDDTRAAIVKRSAAKMYDMLEESRLEAIRCGDDAAGAPFFAAMGAVDEFHRAGCAAYGWAV